MGMMARVRRVPSDVVAILLAFGCLDLIFSIVFNFQRKSTIGLSLGNVLLDLLGGVANCLAMRVPSIDEKSLENVPGNIGKAMLSFVKIISWL